MTDPAPAVSHRREALLTASASVFSAAFAGIASIVIARELGVFLRGEWAAIFALATLVGTLAAFGLPAAAGYAAARVPERERASLVESALWMSLGLGLLAAGVYLVVAEISPPGSSAEATIAAGAGIALFTVTQAVAHQVVLTTVSLRWFAALQVVPAAAGLVGVLALVAVGTLDLLGVVVIYIGRAALGSLVGLGALLYGRVMQRGVLMGPRHMLKILRPYAGYAFFTFGIFSLAIIVQRVDILLVEGYLGSTDAGLYAVGIQIIDLMLLVPGALGFLAFRGAARSSPEHWGRAMRALRWVAVVQLTCAIAIFVFAEDVLRVVFGEEYVAGADALRWLMPAAVFLGLQSVVSNYVAGRGRPRSVAAAWAAGAVIGIGLNLLLIPVYGVEAAAATLSLAYLAIFVLHLPALRAVRPSAPAT